MSFAVVRKVLIAFKLWLRHSFMMKGGMFSTINYFKIFKSIVQLVSINMVNKLKSLKFSAKMLLHNMTMLKNLFSINRNHPISTIVKSSAFNPFQGCIQAISKLPSFIMTVAVTPCYKRFATIFNGTQFHSVYSIKECL